MAAGAAPEAQQRPETLTLGAIATPTFRRPPASPTATPTPTVTYRLFVTAPGRDNITVPWTPTPSPTPVPTLASANCYRSEIDDYFPAWALDEAAYVVFRESSCNPNAVNPSSGACGLFQLLPCTCIDVRCNVAHAYAKWLDGGMGFHKHWYRWW